MRYHCAHLCHLDRDLGDLPEERLELHLLNGLPVSRPRALVLFMSGLSPEQNHGQSPPAGEHGSHLKVSRDWASRQIAAAYDGVGGSFTHAATRLRCQVGGRASRALTQCIYCAAFAPLIQGGGTAHTMRWPVQPDPHRWFRVLRGSLVLVPFIPFSQFQSFLMPQVSWAMQVDFAPQRSGLVR